LTPQTQELVLRPIRTFSESGAPSTDEEVTPAMIEVGVAAYYANAAMGWRNPGDGELREMPADVFKATLFCSQS
jgi:hypothetical protein